MPENITEQVRLYVAQRDAAFESDNLDFFADRYPGADRALIEHAFHLSRLICLSVSEKKRLESQAWLAKKGASYPDFKTPIEVGDALPGGGWHGEGKP